MEINSTSDKIQIFRSVIESLLRTKHTKLKRLMLRKDKKGIIKQIIKEFSNIIEQAIKKTIMTNEINRFFEERSSLNKLRFPEKVSESFVKIMKILLPIKEAKLKMIYRVIKIIILINQPSDFSSIISSNDVMTVSNSSDILSIPQDTPENMTVINNNIEKNNKIINIKDYVSVKSFESEKQSIYGILSRRSKLA